MVFITESIIPQGVIDLSRKNPPTWCWWVCVVPSVPRNASAKNYFQFILLAIVNLTNLRFGRVLEIKQSGHLCSDIRVHYPARCLGHCASKLSWATAMLGVAQRHAISSIWFLLSLDYHRRNQIPKTPLLETCHSAALNHDLVWWQSDKSQGVVSLEFDSYDDNRGSKG